LSFSQLLDAHSIQKQKQQRWNSEPWSYLEIVAPEPYLRSSYRRSFCDFWDSIGFYPAPPISSFPPSTTASGTTHSTDEITSTTTHANSTSEGILVTSDGILVTSDGVLVTSDGVLVTSDGVLGTSDGVLVTSDGVLVTSELTTSRASQTIPSYSYVFFIATVVFCHS